MRPIRNIIFSSTNIRNSGRLGVMDHKHSISPKESYTLVLDVGTTGVKACIFDQEETLVAKSSRAIAKTFPKPGWVEQNPAEMITAAMYVLRNVLTASNVSPSSITGFGIATQRETIVVWDKKTSEPVYPAIVWQDTRTESFCKQLSHAHGQAVREKTGLPIDPYFSASKMRWILDNVPRAQELLRAHQLAVGTVDSWLLWNLAQGSPHLTDYTNASRTLLFNIKTLEWDQELLAMFGIPAAILPLTKPSQATFGVLREDVVGSEIPILAVAGDQQASLYAAGTDTGTTKVTYGTGTFVMQIIGSEFALHESFFTTLAVGEKQPWYAIETKVTSGVQNVDEILRNPKLLNAHVESLVYGSEYTIGRLPRRPIEVVIDGGWIRDGKILSIQSKLSPYSVREQAIFDGTALGMCRMVQLNEPRFEVY